MDTPNVKKPIVWQPLTPPGVASFAAAALGRLLLVQFVMSLLAAAAVVWFLHLAWFPVIDKAAGRLPEQGAIVAGRLDWRGESPVLLAEGKFLAFAVDLEHRGGARSPAHIEVEFGRKDLRVFSLLGYVQVDYSSWPDLGLNRRVVGPWWGAWSAPLLGIIAGLVIVGLMVTWAMLATAYCGIAWLVAFYANRQLNVRGSWLLAGAALMPGALLMIAAIVGYGLGALDPLQLSIAAAAHLVAGWIYLVISPLCLPRIAAAAPTNPFATPSAAGKAAEKSGTDST